MNTPTPAQRVRLASHVTRTRFLHVEDALAIGKLRLFAGAYRPGQGMESHAFHFLDLDDARVLFAALARGEPAFAYKEYKGSPATARAQAVSRVLSVAVKADQVYLELKSGPGKETATGAITPAGKPTTAITVACKPHEARRLGAAVLAYLRAWDVARLLAHDRLEAPPYPLGPAAPPEDRRPAATGWSGPPRPNSHRRPNGIAQAEVLKSPVAPPVQPAAPVSPSPGPPAGPALESAAPPPQVVAAAEALFGDGRLRYGDGSVVDAANAQEMATYRRYVDAHHVAPGSRAALQAFYLGQRPA